MLVRFLSGIVCAILVIVVVLSEKIVVNITVSIASIITLVEVYRAVGLDKHLLLEVISCILAICFTFGEVMGASYITLLLSLYLFAMMILYLIYHKTLLLEDLAKVFFLTVFICYFYANIVFLRKMEYGEFLIWLVLIGAYLTDTFAYLFGVMLGKHKLCPDVSPKKTIEGSIFGVAGCILGFLVFGLILQYYFQFHVNYINLIILGGLSSIAAQIGDLSASVIKRQHNLKDFGSLIPGHGGMYDRTDSLLFVAPTVFLYLSYFSNYVIWR